MLTKSNFNLFVDCPLRFWLKMRRPDLLPPDSESTLRLFAQGRAVDDLARLLFPGGVEVREFNKMGFAKTLAVMAGPTQVIYQPTAVAGELTCRADIFVKNGTAWDLYEVKMNNSVKEPAHYFDVGFQRICFEDAGIKINRTFLVHLNREFVRHGEIDPQELFVIEDITETVLEKLDETNKKIDEALKVAQLTEAPDPRLIELCAKKKCEFIQYYCDGIGGVPKIASQIDPKVLLTLLKRNVIAPSELSAELLESIGYVPEVPFAKIDAPSIRRELAKLEYPLYFFDYETHGMAIPVFDGTRPHQQVPFQYSLHIKESPTAKVEHREFLATDFKNPVPDLLSQLKRDIGPKGSVIVWFESFEKTRNEEMAKMMPEYADFLKNLNERMFDLYLIFKIKNELYANSEFQESASLKAVVPVLCPELSYKNLAIQEGGTASASWPTLVSEKTPAKEKKQLAKNMRDYCTRDTEVMVAILDHLREEVGLEE